METTIKDIAKQVNVSYATVSRALNNKYGVKRETRERVLEAARTLNYRPNAIARGLVKRQTHSIGLVIPDITNPFFPEVARGIEDGAQTAGYNVFLCNTNWEVTRELQYLDLLIEKRVDGILIAPILARVSKMEVTLQSRIPVVFVSKAPRDPACSYVVIDDVRGAFLATQHLIESGYRSIGFIGAPAELLSDEPASAADERLKGYKLALHTSGLEEEPRFICFGDFKRESGYNIVKRWIEAGSYPRAVFGENDLLAIGVMQGAKEKGLSVPHDLAVVGFDDIPLAGFPEIQLTTVFQPKYEMGRIAVQILLERMNRGDRPGENRHIILEPKLIQRASS
jgi:LacI family transcriptional regulator